MPRTKKVSPPAERNLPSTETRPKDGAGKGSGDRATSATSCSSVKDIEFLRLSRRSYCRGSLYFCPDKDKNCGRDFPPPSAQETPQTLLLAIFRRQFPQGQADCERNVTKC